MSLAEMIQRINGYRHKVGQPAIELSSRPSSSGSGTTIEILGNDTVLAKSLHGGAINCFSKDALGFPKYPRPQGGKLRQRSFHLPPGHRFELKLFK